MKTYFRLLSFAKPIEKFAIPYMLCMVLGVIFNTINLALLIHLLDTLFNDNGTRELVDKPDSWLDIANVLKYYDQQMNLSYGTFGMLQVVYVVIVITEFMCNVYR